MEPLKTDETTPSSPSIICKRCSHNQLPLQFCFAFSGLLLPVFSTTCFSEIQTSENKEHFHAGRHQKNISTPTYHLQSMAKRKSCVINTPFSIDVAVHIQYAKTANFRAADTNIIIPRRNR